MQHMELLVVDIRKQAGSSYRLINGLIFLLKRAAAPLPIDVHTHTSLHFFRFFLFKKQERRKEIIKTKNGIHLRLEFFAFLTHPL